MELENEFNLEENFFELNEDNEDGKNEWINEVNRLKRNKLLKIAAAFGISVGGGTVLGKALCKDSNNTVKQKRYYNNVCDEQDSDEETTADTEDEDDGDDSYLNTKNLRRNWRN